MRLSNAKRLAPGRRPWAVLALWLLGAGGADASHCLFIASYGADDAWTGGIERGLRQALGDRCRLLAFYLDAGRRHGPVQLARAGQEAKALLDRLGPDVVITADDQAAQYVIVPYLNGTATPVVFCGINWSAEEYGLSHPNVTGMLEVAPIGSLLEYAIALSGGRHGLYLAADTRLEHKNLARAREVAEGLGARLEGRLVSTRQAWLDAYGEAQSRAFVVLGSVAGIDDWAQAPVRARLPAVGRRLSVTNVAAMMPFSMLGLTKVAEEQGQWAGKAALAILAGRPPSAIPVVASRKWDMWINAPLLEAAGIALPRPLLRRAKRIAAR